MGLLKGIGNFAKGFAQGYIEERGVEGTIEDLAELFGANKKKKKK